MITASSSAPTRIAAARRVSSACRPVSAVRRWMIAISSGSQTTYAPWTAQPMRNVVKLGRERQHPRAQRGDRGREQQHLLVADQVAEPGQRRDHERGDDELRRLEPVDVGVGDVEVVGDVAVDRRVVALQHAAGELDADQEADDREQAVHRLDRLGRRGRASSSGASRSAAGTSGRRRGSRRRRGARRRSGWPRAAPWSSGTARTGRPGRRSRLKVRESVAAIITYGAGTASGKTSLIVVLEQRERLVLASAVEYGESGLGS